MQEGRSGSIAYTGSNCKSWSCRRGLAIADNYVARMEEVSSPEVPLEPVSLRMRHRHGSYDDSSSQDAWLHLQMQADMYNM